MQIVIDISEEVYNSIKSNEKIINYVTKDGGGSMALHGSLAIINGTILKKGEWILQSNGKCKLEYAVRFKCSNCNKITFEESNYCPRCGAEMESD